MFSASELKEHLIATMQELKAKRDVERNKDAELGRSYSVVITDLEKVVAYMDLYIVQHEMHRGT